jgi:serine/threonine protein kinase
MRGVAGDEGRLVAGRYRVQRRLGSGAMGVVWQAIDERLERPVAIKRLLLAPGLTEEQADQARQRAAREGRIAARLQHPNAICVHDVADDDGLPVLVMEYLPSDSLAEVMAERGPVPPLEAARIGTQAASALAAAHAAGIVHRDVKPGNILLGHDGTVKITDFGISRATGDVAVTKTGLLAGTPAFLAPEVARGEDPGPASDVFSLGATLYAAVEGQPPFGDDSNTIALLHRVAAGQVAPPRNAGPVTGLLMQMLHAEPAARPTTAQVSQNLSALAAGPQPPPSAAGATHPTQGIRPARTRLDVRSLDRSPDVTRCGPAFVQRDVRSTHGANRERTIFISVAVLIAVVLGVLVTNSAFPGGSHDIASSGSPSPTQQVSASPSPTVRPAEFERAVAEYYSLLPQETDEAWTRLGPGLQAQDKQQYERFWRGVKDLEVIAQPSATGDSVRVSLEFNLANRERFQEVHQLGMVVRDGSPLINSDQVLASQRINGNSKGKGKGHEDDGDG